MQLIKVDVPLLLYGPRCSVPSFWERDNATAVNEQARRCLWTFDTLCLSILYGLGLLLFEYIGFTSKYIIHFRNNKTLQLITAAIEMWFKTLGEWTLFWRFTRGKALPINLSMLLWGWMQFYWIFLNFSSNPSEKWKHNLFQVSNWCCVFSLTC